MRLGSGDHLEWTSIRELRKPGPFGLPGPVWTLVLWQIGSLLLLLLSLAVPMGSGSGPLPRLLTIGYIAVAVALLVILRDRTPAWLVHAQVALAILIVWGLVDVSVTAVGQLTVAQTFVVLALYVGSWMPMHVALGYVLVGDAGLLAILVLRGLFTNPLVPWLMLTAITTGLAIATSILVRQLRRQAVTDSLTGLLNRTGLLEAVDERSGGRASRTPRSVVVIDIDGMKVVNDRDGHEAGDEMLKRFAADLRATIRTADIPVRTGGDEFVILLSRTTLAEAEAVAQRVINGTSVACSFGVTQWERGEPFDEAWSRADHRMYAQKVERGRLRRAP